jgi:RNA polymerase sigma-70 factor (ECF subfamily)
MARHPADTPVDSVQLGQLLGRVAEGDQEAFEHLYQSTSSKLMGICLRLLPDRAEAEDVLQEVFVTVWKKAQQFDASRASAITWLAMVARNKSIDRLRARPSSARDTPIDLADELPDDGPSPTFLTAAAQDRDRLHACIGELDARRQTLIHVAFFEGSTYEELSRRIGSPLGSIKSWIRRSLIQLRACLER